MKIIQLSQNKQTIIDDEDYVRVSRYKWHCTPRGYAVRNRWINGKRRIQFLHGFILNTPRGLLTDHINRNKLDNRRSNLRAVTPSINRINSSKRKDNTSGLHGVYWDKNKKKWQVMAFFNKKRFTIGTFSDKKSAAYAYNEIAKEIFGEYALLNTL